MDGAPKLNSAAQAEQRRPSYKIGQQIPIMYDPEDRDFREGDDPGTGVTPYFAIAGVLLGLALAWSPLARLRSTLARRHPQDRR